MYETFILKETSLDGYDVIIGGICEKGTSHIAKEEYKKINRLNVYHSNDVFMIDYVLADSVSKLSPKFVKAVGATIHINGVTESTGGVIGDPFSESESSDGSLEKIDENLWLIAYPGKAGIIFYGNKDIACFFEEILFNESISQIDCVKQLEKVADEKCLLYLLVSDGCGLNNLGTVIIKDELKKIKEIL